MKKKLLMIAVFLFVCTGCTEASTADNDQKITTAQEYCREFADADLIVADDGHFYVEATKVNWVTELDLQDTTPLAAVGNNGITESFEAWDATLIPSGTTIARHNIEDTVLVADVDGVLIPYLQYEG